MSNLYEFTTLSCRMPAVGAASEASLAWVRDPAARGTLLGAWRSDIGPLSRVMVLRGFESQEELTAERRRAQLSTTPFNAGPGVTGLDMDSYAPFPFVPPVVTGHYGSVYEIRTYRLVPGGLAPTLAGWEAQLPGRLPRSHLVIAMYTLDGAQRITHIWPYEGADQRAKIRAESVRDGVWPPKSGPENIAEATSTLAVPEAYSPLT